MVDVVWSVCDVSGWYFVFVFEYYCDFFGRDSFEGDEVDYDLVGVVCLFYGCFFWVYCYLLVLIGEVGVGVLVRWSFGCYV